MIRGFSWYIDLQIPTGGNTVNAVTRKMRQRRLNREFDRAVANASPSMRQELIAAASRAQYNRL